MILSKITLYKKQVVKKEKKALPLNVILDQLEKIEKPRNFKKSLSGDSFSIIAEIKKASPSKGIIKENFSPEEIADIYDQSPIDAISVLTEDKFFLGQNKYIAMVKSKSKKPVLRKDFIIDPYQIYQSRLLGADAILIIAALHSEESISAYLKIVRSLNLSAIVEVHTENEAAAAVSAGADIIGINNRNLKTFETSLSVTERIIQKIPKEVLIVSESGIYTRKDLLYLEQLGANAALIGESIMKVENIKEKILELRGEVFA